MAKRTRISKYKAELTDGDQSAGVSMVMTENGPRLRFPPVQLARLHSHFHTQFCRKCKKRLRNCLCEHADPSPAKEPKYEGVMSLPKTHPDHPEYSA